MKTIRQLLQCPFAMTLLLLLATCNKKNPPPVTPVPTISSITPLSGSAGAAVTITGTDFGATTADNTVKFNGAAASITSATTSTLVVAAPAGGSTGPVTVTTKGGTNQVHGLLFEYLRNRVLDANDFFSNRSGLPKPENVQNQFGGNVGVPIIKNKLFGFFDYEGTRIRRGVTRISTVPLPNERIGDFSAAAGPLRGLPSLRGPSTPGSRTARHGRGPS